MNPMKVKNGFTLIELLIVVAIIAILAAIAIPNFLAAQTRSKVSRAQAEMRTTATALESYHVDNNNYPFYNDITLGDNQPLPNFLTTPVAYLSSIPKDLFSNLTSASPEGAFYYYLTEDYSPNKVHNRLSSLNIFNDNIKWLMYSLGPDRTDNRGRLFYDPTNGTVSNGDIIRFGP